MDIIETIKQIEREKGMEMGMERGIEKGMEKKNLEFVENLLINTSFDTKKIAYLANVSEDFVKKVKSALRKNRK